MVIPYERSIEMGVIAACLIDDGNLHEVRDLITPDVFYDVGHRLIYELILDGASDITIIESRLKERNKLESVGGWDFLADLLSHPTGRINEYCQILIEKKITRDVITTSQKMMQQATDGVDPYTLIDELNGAIENIGIQGGVKQSLTPSEIRERDKDKPKAEKLLFGIHQLDDGIYADGNRKGQVLLTMADSGHGKTQFALFKAENLLRNGYKVQWFQLEGYDSETSNYILKSRVAAHDNIFICDALYDIEDIKREARRVNREHDIDFIVFDYVQNIECNQKISKTEKVEYVSSQIRRLAKDLNVVCNPLSQVTIESTRHGWQQEPRYNDVRWSKQLKQDASVITSVFRPSRIDSLVVDSERVENWKGEPVPYNSVFVKQAKVRHGQQYHSRLHLIHTDDGLKPYTPAIEPKQPVPSYYETDDENTPF